MRALTTSTEPFLVWILSTLLAIAFVGGNPEIALTIVVLGGVGMGLSSILSYSSLRPGPTHQRDE